MLTIDQDATTDCSADADWLGRALCRQLDPELWFPEPWEDDTPAKAVCGRCPVRAACLAYSLAANAEHGVWGGLSPEERNEIRGRRRYDARRSAGALDAEGEAA
jgi:WhiB family transcriptional regulator, redox-sensing transcriptional regulator